MNSPLATRKQHTMVTYVDVQAAYEQMYAMNQAEPYVHQNYERASGVLTALTTLLANGDAELGREMDNTVRDTGNTTRADWLEVWSAAVITTTKAWPGKCFS